MSIGEDRVVDKIRQRSAELIDLCEELKTRDARLETTFEEAAMWAVNAATA